MVSKFKGFKSFRLDSITFTEDDLFVYCPKRQLLSIPPRAMGLLILNYDYYPLFRNFGIYISFNGILQWNIMQITSSVLIFLLRSTWNLNWRRSNDKLSILKVHSTSLKLSVPCWMKHETHGLSRLFILLRFASM